MRRARSTSVAVAALFSGAMTTSCAAILGVDEGTEAVIAEPCDGGFEIRTSAGNKCIPRIKLSDPRAIADAGKRASGDSAQEDSASEDSASEDSASEDSAAPDH